MTDSFYSAATWPNFQFLPRHRPIPSMSLRYYHACFNDHLLYTKKTQKKPGILMQMSSKVEDS